MYLYIYLSLSLSLSLSDLKIIKPASILYPPQKKNKTKQSDTGLHHKVSSAQAADIHSRFMGTT